MIRIILITLISFSSVVPYLVVFNRWLDIGNDLVGYVSIFLAWIITQLLLLELWRGKSNVGVISVDIDEPTDEEFERLSIKLKSIENCMLVDPKVKKHEEYSMLELAKIYTRDYGKLPRSCTKYLARLVGLSWLKNA